MSRRLKQHLRAALGEAVPAVAKARCGRYVNRRRLIGARSLGQWKALREMGLACLDLARATVDAISELAGVENA